jgi:hypothetical protein
MAVHEGRLTAKAEVFGSDDLELTEVLGDLFGTPEGQGAVAAVGSTAVGKPGENDLLGVSRLDLVNDTLDLIHAEIVDVCSAVIEIKEVCNFL